MCSNYTGVIVEFLSIMLEHWFDVLLFYLSDSIEYKSLIRNLNSCAREEQSHLLPIPWLLLRISVAAHHHANR